MIIQTFKRQFQCVMWITKHSSIWIAKNSIHCSLPTQLRKLAKCGSWHCHLQWQCTRSCVTNLMQERYQWKEDELFLYLYATCKFSNLLTLEQWAFEYGLPFFLIRTVYPVKASLFASRLMPYLLGLFYWGVCRVSRVSWRAMSRMKSCKIDRIVCKMHAMSCFVFSFCERM